MTIRRISKQAVAYLRVSTEKQGDVGIGLDAQRASIDAYCAAAGIHVIEWFQAVGTGRGEKSFQNRTGLRSALAMAQACGVSLLVDGFDRLSRHTPTFEKILKDKRVAVFSVSDGASTDRLLIASVSARAEFEGDMISQRTKQALGVKKASGIKLGNPTNLPDAQKLGAASNKLRSELKVGELIQALEENNWRDLSVPALVKALNGIGLTTSRNTAWTVEALRRPHRAALLALKEKDLDSQKGNPMFGRF